MIILFYPYFIFSVCIGLDIGSFFSKASTVINSENPKMFYDSKNSQNTPSFLAFHSKPNFDWRKNKPLMPEESGQLYLVFGENALRAMETRPYMGSGFWPLLCNLDSIAARKYTRQFRFNETAARIHYQDLLILYLKTYIDAISAGAKVQDVCLVFPATFIHPQRNIFRNTLKNLQVTNFHSINDVDAVSYVYYVEHHENFRDKPKNILFIDIGGLSIKSYVVKFEYTKKPHSSTEIPKASSYSYVIDRNEGGAYLTNRVVHYIEEKLGLKKVTDDEYRRLFRAAEKLKIDLSDNENAFTIIENVGDIDHQFSLTRGELHNLMRNLVDTTAQIAKNAANGLHYDDIEIIGGTSKNEYVVKSLSELLNHKILQTLPPEETLAIGAGYSNVFRHNDMYVNIDVTEEKTIYNITASTLKDTYSICEPGKKCLDAVSVTNDASAIMFNYDDSEIQQGQMITSFGYYLEYVDEGDIQIKFKHGPLRVQAAFSCIPNKGCKDNKLDPLVPTKPPSQVFEMFMHPELRLKKLNESRGQLENFTKIVLYQVQKNQTFRAFTNFTQRLEIIRCVEREKKWLLEFSQKVTEPVNFTLKLNNLKKIVFPVYKRIEENRSLYEEFTRLFTTIKNGQFGLDISWPLNRSYVDRKVFAEFRKLLTKCDKFLNKSVMITLESPSWMLYPVKAKQIKLMNEELTLKFNEIQLSPPPATPDNPNPTVDIPTEYIEQIQRGYGKSDNSIDDVFEEKKMESFEDFLESKKDPYSIDEL